MSYRYKTVKRDGKTVLLHRWLMEQHLGRKLRADEHVHHINEQRFDNRIENLELTSPAAHAKHHKQKHPLTKACEVCGLVFTPHPTKRARTKTCRPACRAALIAVNRHGVPLAEARGRVCPEMAEAVVRANYPVKKLRRAA